MNGEKNGKLFNGRFSKVDDMILKIGAGVATAILVAIIFFGVQVYAIKDSVLTKEDHTELQDSQNEYVEDHYVQSDVYERDREYIAGELAEINEKLDKLLDDK